MGRYYSGDIDGKFMFAVQSSDAADRFGVTGEQPYELVYYFSEDNLKTIESELAELKPAYDKVLKFFEKTETYNTEMLEKAKISNEELSNYADYSLGQKIQQCILEYGECSFTAEM